MAKSQCASCSTVFTGLTAFDKHQVQKGQTVICQSPESIGLVSKQGKDISGRESVVWGFPQPDEKPKHFNTAPAQPKTYTCACGRKFQGSGKRGRPPKSCTECGGKGKIV